MKYYVYVLKSQKNKSLYKGLTNNLERRLKQHSDGKCKSTVNKRPLELVRVEHFDNRKDAREREKYYKSGIGREELKKLF